MGSSSVQVEDIINANLESDEQRKAVDIISPLYSSLTDAVDSLERSVREGTYPLSQGEFECFERYKYTNILDESDSILVYVNKNRDMILICPTMIDGKKYYERIYHKAHHNKVELRNDEDVDITNEFTKLTKSVTVYKGCEYYIATNGRVHYKGDVKFVKNVIEQLYNTETGIDYANVMYASYDTLYYIHNNDSKFLDMNLSALIRFSDSHGYRPAVMEDILKAGWTFQVNFNNLIPDVDVQLVTLEGNRVLAFFNKFFGEESVRLNKVIYKLIE